MILSLDLKNSYGKQNSDIAKKNKITKVSIPVYSISAQEDSDIGNVSYGPITIDDTGNTEQKIISTSINDNIYAEEYLLHNSSPKFPSYVGTVKYKTYSVLINLSEYPDLKNIASVPVYNFTFSGQRQKALSTEPYVLMQILTEDHLSLSYNDLVSKFEELDFVSGLDNLETTGFWGTNEWAETNAITNNFYTIGSGDSKTENNAYSEIINFIQTGADETRKSDNRFLNLNSFIKPEITGWNNNGETASFLISIPQSIYLFGSKSGQKQVGAFFGTRIIYNDAEFYKYVFNELNISFILNYNVETTNKIYFEGDRRYEAEKSPFFTEKIHLSDTHYVTIPYPDGTTEIVYDNYDYDFSKEIVERYKDGKLELNFKYPVGKIKTLNGIDVVYISNYGISTHIGNRFFDQDSNEILLSETDMMVEEIQIPEGYICNVLNNGSVAYKNTDGTPKYFIVESSSLIYNGIVLNELKLIETTVQIVSSFDESSWAEIDAIGETGQLYKYFTVGEKKYVNISNQPEMANPVPFVILGFNHDDLSNGNGKAGMTVGMESVLIDRYKIDETSKNLYSWADSDFRKVYVPELIKNLPMELQKIVKTVKKQSTSSDTSVTRTSYSDDTLFLQSLTEIVGEHYLNELNSTQVLYSPFEGSQYEYWKSVKDGTLAEDRKKLDYDHFDASTGAGLVPLPVSWATRSFEYSPLLSRGYIADINDSGELFSDGSTTAEHGISYAFCVGEQKTQTKSTNLSLFKVVNVSSITLSPYLISGALFIDWGDGAIEEISTVGENSLTHSYATSGDYLIRVYGDAVWYQTGFGGSSFFGNPTWNQIILGDNVEMTTSPSFSYCYNLYKVRLPRNTTAIGYNAFCDCRSLEVIENQKFVQTIGEYAFYGCSKLPNITIPENVTSIGSRAFSNCGSATSINMKDSVESIGTYAFYGCSSVSEVTLSNSLTYLPEGVFSGCNSLIQATLPDNIKTIYPFAFGNCENLQKVVFPKNISTFKSSVFSGSTSLYYLDFSRAVSVPTIELTLGITKSENTKIIVPDDLYDAWITTTNWVSLADYIYKASEA